MRGEGLFPNAREWITCSHADARMQLYSPEMRGPNLG